MVLLFLYISAIYPTQKSHLKEEGGGVNKEGGLNLIVYQENSVEGMKIFQEGWYTKKGELTNKGVASHFPTMQ